LGNEIMLEQVFKSAFNAVNTELHSSSIDDSLSGTTGIAVIVQGDTIHVGNVGDSRAIIASFDHKKHKLRFSPLSNDQTPFRKDERARLRKCGAKIMSVDQIDEDQKEHDMWGDDGFDSEDPPRVWDASLEMPGCGFTRSLGDSIGEAVGVNSDPEVLSWKLTPDDKYIILASDGVFEFLSSDVVIDMINKVLNKCQDPAAAVKHVISEAFRLWVAHDERTDDITMVLLCLDHFKVLDQATINQIKQERGSDVSGEVVNKRLKAILPTDKAQELKKNWRRDLERYDFKKGEAKKTEEGSEWIAYFLSVSLLLSSLSFQQKLHLTMVARPKNVNYKDILLDEDKEVENLFIVQTGEFAVFQKDDHGIEHRITTLSSPGAVFGDVALMYGYSSAVKVAAMSNGTVWTVNRKAFRAIISGNKAGDLSDKELNNIVITLSN
jgi:serine/threonine protein phosphatase PrpC